MCIYLGFFFLDFFWEVFKSHRSPVLKFHEISLIPHDLSHFLNVEVLKSSSWSFLSSVKFGPLFSPKHSIEGLGFSPETSSWKKRPRGQFYEEPLFKGTWFVLAKWFLERWGMRKSWNIDTIMASNKRWENKALKWSGASGPLPLMLLIQVWHILTNLVPPIFSYGSIKNRRCCEDWEEQFSCI